MDREGTGSKERVVNDQEKAKRKRMVAQKYMIKNWQLGSATFSHACNTHTHSHIICLQTRSVHRMTEWDDMMLNLKQKCV